MPGRVKQAQQQLPATLRAAFGARTRSMASSPIEISGPGLFGHPESMLLAARVAGEDFGIELLNHG
jgi:hypothetical protein